MTWSNPSAEEAEDNYKYYKSRYNNAASQKSQLDQQAKNYARQKQDYANKMSEASSQKLNFEKRLEQIKDIVRMLEGNSPVNDIPSAIARGLKSVMQLNQIYPKAVAVAGVAAASIMDSFDVKTVTADPYSSSALTGYKNEAQRLEKAIIDLQNQINSMSSAIAALNSKISSCNAQSASLQKSMYSSAYEMNHYKKYMD